MRTKHVRGTPQRAGQILKYEASISASNIMIVDPKTKKRSRIGFSLDEKGRKWRIAKSSGEVLVTAKAAPPKKAKVAEEEVTAAKEEVKVVKETKEAKEIKEVKEKVKAETVAAPPRKAFWKRFGFGAEALEEEESPRAQEGGGPDDKGAPSRTRSSGRGS